MAGDTVEDRIASLITELQANFRKHDRIANFLELIAAACFYGSLLAAGLAFVAGLIRTYQIPTEIISVLIAVSTGLTILSRQAMIREKADWHYAVRDTAREYLHRLRYEQPIPPTKDNVASISEQWRKSRRELGARMEGIHKIVGRNQIPEKSIGQRGKDT